MDHLARSTARLLVALSTGCLVLEPAPTRPGSEEPASEEDGVRISGSHNSFGYAMTALGDVDGETLAAAGDVNGDHIPDLLVGPPLEPGMEDEADVFLWYLE